MKSRGLVKHRLHYIQCSAVTRELTLFLLQKMICQFMGAAGDTVTNAVSSQLGGGNNQFNNGQLGQFSQQQLQQFQQNPGQFQQQLQQFQQNPGQFVQQIPSQGGQFASQLGRAEYPQCPLSTVPRVRSELR